MIHLRLIETATDAFNVSAGASLLSNMGIFLLVNNTLVSKQDVKWENDLNALFIYLLI